MKLVIAMVLVLSSLSFAFADETLPEQAQAKGNNVKRAVKKGVNQMKEKACKKGDAKCLKEKVDHRVEESAEAVSDKAKEAGNKID